MGRAHPVGIIVAAVLFGVLYQGGAESAFEKPKISRDMIVVIQGFVVLFAGALEHMFRRPVATLLARRTAQPPISTGGGDGMVRRVRCRFPLPACRPAVPLILACLAGLWSERSGVVDIGLEGKMLTGAFAAAAFATFSGNAWVGLLAGVAASIAISLVHGYASIDQRANQIVSGTAINMVSYGLTALICTAVWSQGGRTPQLPHDAQFNTIDLPFAESFGTVPILGPIYRHSDLRPRRYHLCGLRLCSADLLGAVQHAFRAAAARSRRESGRGRHRRHFCARPALPRRGDLRRAGRTLRCLSLHRTVGVL